MHSEFLKIGQDLFTAHLITTHGGNMSVRVGDRILITRRGSMLHHLTERDVVETGLEKNDAHITLASTEILVHRTIYKETSALSIVHTHPPYAIAQSLIEDEIIPVDSEGSYILHKVPVVECKMTAGSSEMANVVSQALKEYKIVMLRGHGCFAIGQMLEEAAYLTSALENSCKILAILKMLGVPLKEYREKSEEYVKW